MLQLFPLLLVATVLAADSGVVVGDGARPEWATGIALGSVLAIVLVAAGLLKWCTMRLAGAGAPAAILFGDRVVNGGRWLLVVVHAAAVLGFGWLDAVRGVTGDLVLIDEVVCILPPLAGAVALWWLHFPLERRLREALVVRRLDRGGAVHGIPSRGRYVLEQARLHILLMLVPIVLILGLSEGVRLGVARFAPETPVWASDVATLGIGLGVFLFAPLLARVVLRVRPLPDGEVRDDLAAVCRANGVRVRDILLWQTDGAMINAAVMGLVGPLRYVLLTDGLIESLARPQVIAVMAHEIGHVRRHHMPWLVTALLAILLGASTLATLPLLALDDGAMSLDRASAAWLQGGTTLAAGALALLVFGWVSRRFERQADTFAVQHLSRTEGDDDASGCVRRDMISADAVWAMHSALQTIARLNAVDPNRRSWRHGSIAWRQAHLVDLLGRPLEGLAIDRVVRRLKVGAALVFVLGVAALGAVEWYAVQQEAERRNEALRVAVPLPPWTVAEGGTP